MQPWHNKVCAKKWLEGKMWQSIVHARRGRFTHEETETNAAPGSGHPEESTVSGVAQVAGAP